LAGANDDNGVREIQLNGKQLVFLFMAATVVSVVIFLCGVLVGRGVRTERAVAAEAASNVPGAEPPAAAPAPASTAVDLTKVEPPTPPAEAVDTTSHDTPAGGRTAVNTDLPKAQEPTPVTVGHDVKHDAKQEAPAPAPAARRAGMPGGEPQGPGFVVQVAALNVRSEADAIAKRLSSKGYDAYVLPSASGAPQVFRVRVGKFASRREAESIATRLQKEEQFKPWVTR
jgi:cell division septation protein DedD